MLSFSGWADSSCCCNINPPCSKCMATCGECGGYYDEEEGCQGSCNEEGSQIPDHLIGADVSIDQNSMAFINISNWYAKKCAEIIASQACEKLMKDFIRSKINKKHRQKRGQPERFKL